MTKSEMKPSEESIGILIRWLRKLGQRCSLPCSNNLGAPVAQLDRASDF